MVSSEVLRFQFLCFLPYFHTTETTYAIFGTKAFQSLLSGVCVFVLFVSNNDIDTVSRTSEKVIVQSRVVFFGA